MSIYNYKVISENRVKLLEKNTFKKWKKKIEKREYHHAAQNFKQAYNTRRFIVKIYDNCIVFEDMGFPGVTQENDNTIEDLSWCLVDSSYNEL